VETALYIGSRALNALKDGGVWLAGWIAKHPGITAIAWPVTVFLAWLVG